jgi:hypothetical protein
MALRSQPQRCSWDLTQRRKDAKTQRQMAKNASQTNNHPLAAQLGNANFFFAPWRLCVEIFAPYCMDTTQRGRNSTRLAISSGACLADDFAIEVGTSALQTRRNSPMARLGMRPHAYFMERRVPPPIRR